MLNCQHHISWVRAIEGGLHQCILCTAVVTKKDVYPRPEDLPDEFVRRWDAHEATRPAAAPAPAEVKPAAKAPATAAATTAPTATAAAVEQAAPEETTPTRAAIPRAPAPPRVSIPPADPHPGS